MREASFARPGRVGRGRTFAWALVVPGLLLLGGCSVCRDDGLMPTCTMTRPPPVPPSDLPPGAAPPTRRPEDPVITLPRRGGDTPREVADTARAEMRAALEAVAAAQEDRKSRGIPYAPDLRLLAAEYALVLPGRVVVTITTGGVIGWAARAEHLALPARTCVIWVGSGLEPRVPSTARELRRGDLTPGEPVCDGDGASPARAPAPRIRA
jgi:hypothetical protein